MPTPRAPGPRASSLEGPGTKKSSRSGLVTLMHWGQLIDGGSWHACRCRSRAETAILRLLVRPVTIVAAKTRKCCKGFAAAVRGDFKCSTCSCRTSAVVALRAAC